MASVQARPGPGGGAVTADPMLPASYRVASRTVETHDSVTLQLAPVGPALPPIAAGQFMMLAMPGVGEIPVSVSGDRYGTLTHTIRAVGAVSTVLHDAVPGTMVGVRGPFGTCWDLAGAEGRDVIIAAGGVGLAPLRPVIREALLRRGSYHRLILVAGARTPAEFLFRDELEAWADRPDTESELTVDQPAAGWHGPVGFVTEPLARLSLDAGRTTAFLCGPEPMMRFSARVLQRKGVAARDIQVSLERNMVCGIGLCGHCQLGPILVCRDGPVLDYATAEPLLDIREL